MRVVRVLWSLFWTLVVLGLLAACGLGIYNVVRDDADVQMLAEAAACEGEGPGCAVERLAGERGALAETFEMLNGRQEVLRVRCARQQVVLGEYTCKVRDRFKYAGGGVPVYAKTLLTPGTAPGIPSAAASCVV